MALGASPRDVLALVLRQGLMLVAVGSALGLFAGSALAGALKGLLYGVEGFDVPTFLAATLAMLFVAILAAGRPALRASRIDPVLGLRQE
ncbi:MAG: FtsX-like permease family protein [Acidobacteria bacterium]|nr:FtsX-like permease family protein [Acidobacteriota bacterium]